MPTGGGKSLCYQLPALLQDGLTVVVSPLISLMQDQVDRLQTMGVAATYINSSLDVSEIGRRQAAVARGAVKLLYVAPERVLLPGFLRLLSSVHLAFFAIDEAHCISEWGHDFRPEYRALTRLRELFPSTPLAAFTATATRRVQADIVAQLRLQQAATFRGSFNRPNLYYDVRPKHAAYEQLRTYLRARGQVSGIIYCQSRAGTESLAARLAADGFDAVAYHAGLEAAERKARQVRFLQDDVLIIVATIAFGMGIDKPDVRFVVHYDLPKTLEAYYQESGRAGRDGEASDCILFYSSGDAAKHAHFIRQKPSAAEQRVALHQLNQMVTWASSTACRRRALLAYFDEQLDGQSGPCCDVCREPIAEVDSTAPAHMFLSCVQQTREWFGSAYLISVLRGSRSERLLRLGHEKLPTYGLGRDRSTEEWQHLVQELLREGYVRQAADEFNALKLTERGRGSLRKREKVTLRAARTRAPGVTAPVEQPHQGLFDELCALRKRLADERGVPPYVIFYDTTLRHIAAELPTSREHLLRIQGVGTHKLAEFADAFLAMVADYVRRSSAVPVALPPPPASPRVAKLTPTIQATLDLFNDGHSVAAIAASRQLALSTVEDHLVTALEAGERLDVGRLVSPEKRRAIEAAIADLGPGRLKPLMERLGDGYTYVELKVVRAALSSLDESRS
jgi:ATP-dependent DNA helicase RecQ